MSTLDTLREAAAKHAAELSADFVGTEHLFLAWLASETGPIADAMSAAGLTSESFREVVAKGRKGRGRGRPPTGAGDGGLSSHAQRVLDAATERASGAGREEATAEDLVLAMVHEPRGAIARALTEFDVKPSRLKALATDRPQRGRNRRSAPDPSVAPDRAPTPPPPTEPKPGRRGSPREQTAAQATPPASKAARVPRQERTTVVTTAKAGGSEVDTDLADPGRRGAPLDIERGRRISWLTPLYLAIPLAIWFHWSHQDPLWVFIASCVGVLPLAGLMGTATEQLAERSGPAVGGLLNATFGNAAELIIAIAALRAGLVDLVKASITGSILGNLLLILGLSLVAGGLRRPMLRFNRTNAGMGAAMLALAVAGLIFPTLFHSTHPDSASLVELHFSEAVAGILIATYLFSLLFVLRTHRPLFGGGHLEGEELSGTWSIPKSVGYLALATVGVAVMSEILVHAVEPLTASIGVSQIFLGLIIIPIIGNAAEHGTAVVAARRGHTDLALQIALGSSTQIALLVAPLLVFIGAAMAVPGMNLVFSPFEVVGLSVAVVTSAMITLDGESHWFEGVQLLALYAMFAAAVWFI
ncbi:MAG TPA: calcium/proton exchanger [Gemmatimonadales bacterium]|nr:calcium/proton exchanger [Gemmatimonadales bacterium]